MCIPLILFPTVITFETPATQAVTEYVQAENDVLPSGSVSEPSATEDDSGNGRDHFKAAVPRRSDPGGILIDLRRNSYRTPYGLQRHDEKDTQVSYGTGRKHGFRIRRYHRKRRNKTRAGTLRFKRGIRPAPLRIFQETDRSDGKGDLFGRS